RALACLRLLRAGTPARSLTFCAGVLRKTGPRSKSRAAPASTSPPLPAPCRACAGSRALPRPSAARAAARWPLRPGVARSARRASIDALACAAGLGSVAPALELDAVVAGWGDIHAGQALILVVNLLRLVSWPEAEVLLAESARALRPGGRMMIYGPFLRDGE